MKRREIIIFSATALVFVITNLALRDILDAESFLSKSLIAGFSGLLGFWWGFRLITNKKEKWQIITTVAYLATVLLTASMLMKRETHSSLTGTWNSPAGPDEDELQLTFFEKDSSIMSVNGKDFLFWYKRPTEDSIVMSSRIDDELEFEWIIQEQTATDLILLDDEERPIKFKKIGSK